jgi:hypothetical protein
LGFVSASEKPTGGDEPFSDFAVSRLSKRRRISRFERFARQWLTRSGGLATRSSARTKLSEDREDSWPEVPAMLLAGADKVIE